MYFSMACAELSILFLKFFILFLVGELKIKNSNTLIGLFSKVYVLYFIHSQMKYLPRPGIAATVPTRYKYSKLPKGKSEDVEKYEARRGDQEKPTYGAADRRFPM